MLYEEVKSQKVPNKMDQHAKSVNLDPEINLIFKMDLTIAFLSRCYSIVTKKWTKFNPRCPEIVL